jgi:hypothetical protein
MSARHLKRLEHIRGLLAAKGEPGAQDARLLLFDGVGFSDALIQRASTNPSVQLIGLDRLYYGWYPSLAARPAASPLWPCGPPVRI